MTLNTSPSLRGQSMMHALVLLRINQLTKFEMPINFTCSKDMTGNQKIKKKWVTSLT